MSKYVRFCAWVGNAGRRTVSIGDKQFDCSLIDGRNLPDYPQKDTCTALADNHYAEGDKVVHYNLPARQQTAVEKYFGVRVFPTYRLIDRNGTILDVNADPGDLEALAGLPERMK